MRTHDQRMGGDKKFLRPTNAFLRFDEQQIRAVYRFIYHHVGNREVAEELTAQTFMQATPDAETHPFTNDQLCHIAQAVVAEYLRWFYATPASDAADTSDASDASSATVGADEAQPASAQSRSQPEATSCARHVLAQLPAQERDFLTRRFLQNASLAEAATAMRMTVSEAQALQWLALYDAAQIATNAAIPAVSCANVAQSP